MGSGSLGTWGWAAAHSSASPSLAKAQEEAGIGRGTSRGLCPVTAILLASCPGSSGPGSLDEGGGEWQPRAGGVESRFCAGRALTTRRDPRPWGGRHSRSLHPQFHVILPAIQGKEWVKISDTWHPQKAIHPWLLSSSLCSLGCGTLPAGHVLDLVTLQGTSDQLVQCRASSGGRMSQLHSGNKALVLFAPPTWSGGHWASVCPSGSVSFIPGAQSGASPEQCGVPASPQSQRKATQAARKRVLAPPLHQSRPGCLPGFPSLTATWVEGRGRRKGSLSPRGGTGPGPLQAQSAWVQG